MPPKLLTEVKFVELEVRRELKQNNMIRLIKKMLLAYSLMDEKIELSRRLKKGIRLLNK